MAVTADASLHQRDLTLDLARVSAVLLVVVAHLLLTGVGIGADGAIVVERTAESQPWFAAASWLGNIMPLFFVVGGFAAKAGWQSMERRDAAARAAGTAPAPGAEPSPASRFVRTRLARLARPALPLFVFLTVALVAVWAAGIDPQLVDAAAIGVGSPLWFLAAYMLAQALAPAMLRLHRRAPVVTLVALAGAASVIDAVRLLAGVELLGLPNVVLIWVAVQQLGFFLHDGWFRSRPAWMLALIVVAGYALLLALVPAAGYSPNMLTNQFPPTMPMLVLGVVQAAMLTLLHRPLAALTRTRPVRALLGLAGSRLMTIYLWHVPVITIITGLQLLLPLPMPAPGSPAWWWSRILVLALVLAIVWAASLWLVRFERPPAWAAGSALPGTAVTAAAVLVFVLAPFLVMVLGLDTALAALGTAGTAVALWLIRGRRAPAPLR